MSSDTPSQSQAPATSESPASTHPPTSSIGKTWKQAEGLPETVAPLEKLPEGVQFGEDFPEPICYDPQRKVLKYRGQMFHGNFTYLSSLSRDVRFYQALEVIFVKSTKATPAKRWWLW